MSQAKVDRYKEEKKNRKQIMKKAKIKKTVNTVLLSTVCLAFVGWIGYSAVKSYQANQPASYTEVNYDAINNYLSEMEGK